MRNIESNSIKKQKKSDLYVFIILILMLVILIVNSTISINDFVFNLLMSMGLSFSIFLIYDSKIKNRQF